MSRTLLIVPPGPSLNRSPSLAVSYLAAALLSHGHEVEVFDPGAPHGPDRRRLAERVSTFGPHLLGMGLYADFASLGYRLLEELPRDFSLAVAGGPHATAVPAEPLAHGFDVTVVGEGEEAIVELADLAGNGSVSGRELDRVRGIAYRDVRGEAVRTAPRPRLEDLDRLPPPHEGAKVFPRDWYLLRGEGSLPGSLLASRGCRSTCTFCANLVSGRRRRAHSVPRVLAEVRAHLDREGPSSLSFLDDSFTADRERFLELIEAIGTALPCIPPWWCECRVDQFDGEIARAAVRGGCHTVVFGMESGHPEILRRIGKGISPEQSLAAARSARDAGLTVYANFMLGFPFEEEAHVRTTLEFMETLAPWVHVFSPLGIVTPYPGTGIYRRYADRCGFANWWLDEEVVGTMHAPLPPGGYALVPPSECLDLLARMESALLEIDFFGLSPEVKAAIRDVLAFRREHNGPHYGSGGGR